MITRISDFGGGATDTPHWSSSVILLRVDDGFGVDFAINFVVVLCCQLKVAAVLLVVVEVISAGLFDVGKISGFVSSESGRFVVNVMAYRMNATTLFDSTKEVSHYQNLFDVLEISS